MEATEPGRLPGPQQGLQEGQGVPGRLGRVAPGQHSHGVPGVGDGAGGREEGRNWPGGHEVIRP